MWPVPLKFHMDRLRRQWGVDWQQGQRGATEETEDVLRRSGRRTTSTRQEDFIYNSLFSVIVGSRTSLYALLFLYKLMELSPGGYEQFTQQIFYFFFLDPYRKLSAFSSALIYKNLRHLHRYRFTVNLG